MIMQFFAMPRTEAARVSSEQKKIDSCYSSNKNSQFESILDARLSRNADRKASLRSPMKETDSKEEKQINSVSYRQAGERTGSIHAKKATDNSKANQKEENYEELNVRDEEMNAKRKSSSNLLNIAGILAPIMNMDSEELVLLLESAGIELSDLTAGSNVEEIVSKLSELVGLNENQKKILTELLGMTESLLADQALDGGSGYGSENSNFVSIDHDGVNVVNQEKSVDLTEIIARFKAQLEEKSIKNDSTEANIPEDKEIMPLDAKDILDEAGISEVDEQVEVPESSEQMDVGFMQEENLNGEPEMKGNPGENPVTDVLKSDIRTAEDFENEYNSAITNMTSGAAEKTSFDTGSVKVSESVGAKSDEILYQVVEKAKVVLTTDKSEMVMDLKPDHLGKLSLKLVTENGIVMANFTAESQQVKEVLEANMQLLKSALEKQGFVVQGFNVSVGRDSNSGFEKRSFTGERLKAYGIRNEAVTGMAGSVATVMDVPDAINPYMISGSSIDLTA